MEGAGLSALSPLLGEEGCWQCLPYLLYYTVHFCISYTHGYEATYQWLSSIILQIYTQFNAAIFLDKFKVIYCCTPLITHPPTHSLLVHRLSQFRFICAHWCDVFVITHLLSVVCGVAKTGIWIDHALQLCKMMDMAEGMQMTLLNVLCCCLGYIHAAIDIFQRRMKHNVTYSLSNACEIFVDVWLSQSSSCIA